MGIYEDWQIHTRTGFRPIKLQESRSGPHANRTPSNKGAYGLAYGLVYGPANCRSDTCHQTYYFRRVIGEISSVRMWNSISSLPYFKSNMRHEETVLVSSMLFQISDCVKTFKILFSQIKSVSRFISVWQACFQTMLKRRIFTWSIEILGLIL